MSENDIPSKDQLVTMLKEGVVVVDFDKVNGDNRVMTCTLSPDILPPPSSTETTKKSVKKEESLAVSVWDINAQGWRSFRYDLVKKISVKD